MILSALKTARRDSSQSKPPSPSATSTVVQRVVSQTPLDSTDVDEPANATLDDGHENPWLESDEVKETLGEDCRLVDYDDWHLWKADVSTTESATLEAKELDLASNTVVTGIRIEYGAVAADFTTRSDTDSWTRDDLKDEHDDLDDAKAILRTIRSGRVVHMQATSAYTPQTALTNSARVDLCRNGGGDKLESHDEDSVIQRCTLPQDLPATGSVPIAACITALLTSVPQPYGSLALGRSQRSASAMKSGRASPPGSPAFNHLNRRIYSADEDPPSTDCLLGLRNPIGTRALFLLHLFADCGGGGRALAPTM